MELSVVTTMYYSAPYLQEFYRRITQESKKLTDNYEIIFVNDGSPDNSLKFSVALCQDDPKICVVDLSRNFGHHRAMMTGLQYAKGDLVFLIDCDLEETPELLSKFHQKLTSESVDVVYGVQKKRRGSWFEKVSGEIYYWLLNSLSGINFPKNVVTARLMSQRYVKSLLRHRERELTIAGLWHITGYEQRAVIIDKHDKRKTTYNFFRKLRIFINSIVSFSDRLLILIFYSGVSISLISMCFIINIIFRKLTSGIDVIGWTSVIVSIWLVGGLILSSLGIIGLYISKIFIETKQRPYSITRAVYRRSTISEK